jgi:hypothetical protein
MRHAFKLLPGLAPRSGRRPDAGARYCFHALVHHSHSFFDLIPIRHGQQGLIRIGRINRAVNFAMDMAIRVSGVSVENPIRRPFLF